MKTCSKCKIEKPLEDFHRGSCPQGRQAYCKPCRLAKNREWAKANPDSTRAFTKAYCLRHPERRRATVTSYLSRYPEAGRVKDAARFAKRHGVESTLTEQQWLEILSRHNHRCVYCGDPYESIDHVVPMSRGGINTSDNVVPACGFCNPSKSNKTPEEWRQAA